MAILESGHPAICFTDAHGASFSFIKDLKSMEPVVQSFDTLSGLASKYDINLESLQVWPVIFLRTSYLWPSYGHSGQRKRTFKCMRLSSQLQLCFDRLETEDHSVQLSAAYVNMQVTAPHALLVRETEDRQAIEASQKGALCREPLFSPFVTVLWL